MQFVLVAFDDTDEEALNRRLAVREAHLQTGREMFASGRWLYAAGILSDEGCMIGSMIVCDFPSRQEMERQWLDKEPYILGNVWKNITIHRAQVAPFIA